MTLDIAADRYWLEVGQHHVEAKGTQRDLARIVRHFGKDTLLADITDSELARLIALRRSEGVSNATVNRTVTELLRKVLRRAREAWGQEFRPPDWRVHMLPEPRERVRELSAAEEAALAAVLRPDYVPIWRFALATGVRMREAVDLTWDMVDWGNRTIRLRVKGGKEHVVPISTEVREILLPLQGHHATAVFTYVCQRPERDRAGRKRGQRYPISYQGLKTAWRRARARSGVEDYRFHDNRHTAATRLLRSGANLKVVKELLGHEDIATTSKYAHVSLDDVRESMERAADSRRNDRSAEGGNDKPLEKKAD